MCTAISFNTKDNYFGRNLDLEYSYNETITITPRNYIFRFRKVKELCSHYAMIGMAYVSDGYPLYYDATNEKGLSMAGLNFPGNAFYKECEENRDNVAPFELIPWILGQCDSVKQAKKLLENINIVNIDFTRELPCSPLHWIIADREDTITLESTRNGVFIYDNPVGVLTNNPTFDYHMMNINNYMSLSNTIPQNNFSTKLDFLPYSRGMGAIGMPGDLSSSSRFVRAAFAKLNSYCGGSETESVSQFFHILAAVEMPKGCVKIEDNLYEYTMYSSCCNADKGIYYYKTYDNSGISAVNMYKENLDGHELILYSQERDMKIGWQN